MNTISEALANIRAASQGYHSVNLTKTSRVYNDHESIRRHLAQQEQEVKEVVERCDEGITDYTKLVETTGEQNNHMLDKTTKTVKHYF